MPVTVVSALPWPLLAASLAGGAVVALTVGLWAYYGTAVFFEMLRAGLAACF